MQDRENQRRYLLTVAHVVGPLHPASSESDVVFHNPLGPAPQTAIRVGRTARSFPATEAEIREVCPVDASLVEPDHDVRCSRDIDRDLRPTGACYSPFDAALLDLPVRKTGARSGTTTGFIVETAVRLTASHHGRTIVYPFGYFIMSDTEGSPFTLPGDSGAVVTDHQGKAVGLIVAMQNGLGDPSA